MKVVLVSSVYPPVSHGGAEKAVSLLSEGLMRSGIETVVLSLHPGKDEGVEVRNGIKIYWLPLDNSVWTFDRSKRPMAPQRTLWHLRDIWNVRAAKRIGRVLDIEKPDIVHTHVIAGFSIAVWKEVRQRRIGLVHTMHDYYLLCYRSSMFKNDRRCETQCVSCRVARVFHPGWSDKVDYGIPVSGALLRIHRKNQYLSGVRSKVVYNICPAPTDKKTKASRLSSEATLVFGFIGKLEESKGIRDVLVATRQLQSSNWQLLIAGSGYPEYVGQLKEEFPDRRISWMGFVTPAEFYSAVDVVVVPSKWNEPSAYVVVESILSGKGLICSDAGGSAELASLSKVFAVYRTGDTTALAVAMDQALANPQEWSESGLICEDKNPFSEKNVVAEHIAVYSDVLDRLQQGR